MLAVTEVNSCTMCSYAHSKRALQTGMTPKEIEILLAGQVDRVPKEELTAVLFAQHYAETGGKLSTEAAKRLKQCYDPQADTILAITHLIMAGNAFGIPLESIKGRFLGTPDYKSNLCYELLMLLTAVVMLPFVLVIAIISALCSKIGTAWTD